MELKRSASVVIILVAVVGIIIGSWVLLKDSVVEHTLSSKISLNILFSHHQLATDLPLSLFQERLRESDIFLMEYPTWSADWEEDMNRVSQGILSPQEFFSKRQTSEEAAKSTFQFLDLQLNALYKSGVFVTSVDLQANDPLGNKINEYVPVMNQTQLYTDFYETLKLQRKKYEYWTGLQTERQQYMVDRFVELIDVINNRKIPAIKEKPEIRILYVLGSNHVRVYDLLKERGINVSKEYSHTPYTYDYPGEATIKFINGEDISDELLANGLFQTELLNGFGLPWVYDEEKSTRLIRKITSQFTFDELKNIFVAMANSRSPESMFKQMVTASAKEKNIMIPVTRQEFDNLDI
ncbi:MAG: hypothetical protein HYX23_01620 [Candidatus Zambryskibacteria bacterium]|nr:hypothetical protein [Candidatus Zambryskibacteria bacterium]